MPRIDQKHRPRAARRRRARPVRTELLRVVAAVLLLSVAWAARANNPSSVQTTVPPAGTVNEHPTVPSVTPDLAGQVQNFGEDALVTFRFVLRNNSRDGVRATGAVLTDPLPEGVTHVHVSARRGRCSGDDILVGCILSNPDPGETATIDLHLKLPQAACRVSDTAMSNSDQPLTADSDPTVTLTIRRRGCWNLTATQRNSSHPHSA